MTQASSPRESDSLAARHVIVRVAGLWVFLGGLAKWLLGSPNDLPRFLWDLPLDRATLFFLVISFELVLGLFAMLRPTRGWLPLIPLFFAFMAVLFAQIAAGATSCGCLGGNIPVPPWVMLVIDGLLLAAILFVARPWRWRRRALCGWPILMPLLLLAAAAPWVYSRAVTPGEGEQTGFARNIDPDAWKGETFKDIDIVQWLDPELIEPTALYIFYVDSCEVCRDHLQETTYREHGERIVYLLRMWDRDASPETKKVGALPTAPYYEKRDLKEGIEFSMTPPVEVEVKDGVVVRVLEGGEEKP